MRRRPDCDARSLPLPWVGILAGFAAISIVGASEPIDRFNVIWSTPSTNSSGSMPLGNGDVGLNLWVEKNGDLQFYVSKTDAWDEHARLLKLGKVRLALTPNPFADPSPFHQELRLGHGDILVQAGPPGARVELRVWADANQPVIHLEGTSQQPVLAAASIEVWRASQRTLGTDEAHGVDRFAREEPPSVYPDILDDTSTNRVVWYHHNKRSLWQAALRHQGLESFLATAPRDPLLDRIFGGALSSSTLTKTSPSTLRSARPSRDFSLTVHVLTRAAGHPNSKSGSDGSEVPAKAVAEWLEELKLLVQRTKLRGGTDGRGGHERWWREFWSRSWVRVTAAEPSRAAQTEAVSMGYALQRFVSACGGRGAFPIKFNGSIFTVDVPGRFDADYRMWGGGYWFQNTRLPYWPMLESGDHDMMMPLFRMYLDALPLAEARTRNYYGHEGAFFPETIHFWGTYQNGEMGYGWDRQGEPLGRPVNRYIRYYWSGGLELVAMMLDYYAFTKDVSFLQTALLPLAGSILEFYARHYPREPNGRILFAPAQALETWWECENPMPEVASLRFVLNQLLAFSAAEAGENRLSAWRQLLHDLPPVPRREINGVVLLQPAESYRTSENMENPELYAIFPYRLFGVGKPELELARRTFDQRRFRGNSGWQQDDVQMAFLGLADSAATYVAGRFAAKDPASRFPAFWGPNFDWVPDQDHGGNGMMAVQTMLLQHDGRRILLFPAWPKEWNVDFKLHAPFGTTVEGVYREGKLERLVVTPTERTADILDCLNRDAQRQ